MFFFSMKWKGLLEQYFRTPRLLYWHLWLQKLVLMESVQMLQRGGFWKCYICLSGWSRFPSTEEGNHASGITHRNTPSYGRDGLCHQTVIFSWTFHRCPWSQAGGPWPFLLTNGEWGKSRCGSNGPLFFCYGSLRGRCSGWQSNKMENCLTHTGIHVHEE